MPPVLHFGPLKEDREFLMYRYATPSEADAAFYASYDASFLVRKCQLLYSLYEQSDSQGSGMRPGGLSFDGSEKELRTFLATELHCAVFHQAEALIALLLAEYQGRPDFVYLTSYSSSEIKEAARAIAKGSGTIPRTCAKNLRQLVEQGVYANWDLSNTDVAAEWRSSIESIAALLRIVSRHLIDGHEYNSYKHGLRVFLGSSVCGVSQDEDPHAQNRMIAVMPHSMTFLQIEKLGEDYGAQMVTKEVNPEYSFKVVQCMGSLLTTIKSFRRARINGNLSDEIILPFYDTAQLVRLKPVTKVGFSY